MTGGHTHVVYCLQFIIIDLFYNHTCGKSSPIITQLFIISFTAYPTYTPDYNSTQQTVYFQSEESIVIPCGIRVSATSNFEVEWTRVADTAIPLMNVTLDSKYGLILENVSVTDSGTV